MSPGREVLKNKNTTIFLSFFYCIKMVFRCQGNRVSHRVSACDRRERFLMTNDGIKEQVWATNADFDRVR